MKLIDLESHKDIKKCKPDLFINFFIADFDSQKTF